MGCDCNHAPCVHDLADARAEGERAGREKAFEEACEATQDFQGQALEDGQIEAERVLGRLYDAIRDLAKEPTP